MPKTVKKKKTKTIKPKINKKIKTKVSTKPKEINKGPIKISKTYIPKENEKYMCEKHKVFLELSYKSGEKNL